MSVLKVSISQDSAFSEVEAALQDEPAWQVRSMAWWGCLLFFWRCCGVRVARKGQTHSLNMHAPSRPGAAVVGK